MKTLKNFVVFEGCDGSGTTTQIEKLKNVMAAQNANGTCGADGAAAKKPPALCTTFEPTDGPAGRLIRQALKNEIRLNPETIAYLFAADRNEHLFGPGGIAERCGRGELVVCDRYTPSSHVYQGITCGEELPRLLNAGFPGPEMLIFLDVEPETAQKRMKDRPLKEIYEVLDFQIRAREKYLALLPRLVSQGIIVEVIDASLSPDEVAARVWSALQKLPIFK